MPWSLGGLTLDICGAFLLSVEAIKLENIRNFRDRHLKNLSTMVESPLLVFDDTVLTDEFIRENQKRGLGHPAFFQFMHYVAGAAVLIALKLLAQRLGFDPAAWVGRWLWSLPLAARVIVGLVGGLLFVVVIVWMVGEMVHMTVEKSVNAIIYLLEAIDRNTPTGTTGIIGFMLLFLGYLGQAIGTALSA